ncbi:CPBP family intramembrane glutamic endopeptidase [Sediminicola luteus]|uniref:CPBP family intramembrane metalloprotease domain-containing protein n=1 Tax=Sediminicola luteus TaxID=319238 RepID=A0A2A4G4J4_9FLAO|nr:type II CAAX endopeptidase family protein [Sediminicola luteus]PCE63879.1 CPBP family intramembrane metalloprotease domain-containing protein [Sediminicola luteus]
MFIEQGYRGKLGVWKFFLIPVCFLGLMGANYVALQFIDDPEAMIRESVALMGENLFLLFNLIPLAAGLFLVWLWVKYAHPQSITSLTTSRKKVDWKRIGFAFGLWALISGGMVALDVSLNPDSYVYNFQLDKFVILAIIAITLIPLQTSFEEYLFRAHLLQGLGILTKTRWVPLFVTSILFGIMHMGNPEVMKLGPGIMIFYIGTGFFLGIITLLDEGLELALGFHAANNLVTALLVTADWTAFQTASIYKDVAEPTLNWEILIPVLVIYPILILIFAKKYGWTQFKEKLFGRVLTADEARPLLEN